MIFTKQKIGYVLGAGLLLQDAMGHAQETYNQITNTRLEGLQFVKNDTGWEVYIIYSFTEQQDV